MIIFSPRFRINLKGRNALVFWAQNPLCVKVRYYPAVIWTSSLIYFYLSLSLKADYPPEKEGGVIKLDKGWPLGALPG